MCVWNNRNEAFEKNKKRAQKHLHLNAKGAVAVLYMS